MVLLVALVPIVRACTLTGSPEHDWVVTVHPEGAAPFDVLIRDATLRADLGTQHVEVEAPLAFGAAVTRLGVAPDRERWVSDVLYVTPASRLVPLAVHGLDVELT